MAPPNILDPYFVKIFPHLPPQEQRSGVDTLKAKCTEIEDAGSTDAQLAMMGQKDDCSLSENERKAIVAAGLDQCYWQLSQFLRVSTVQLLVTFSASKVHNYIVLQYSTPTRVEEAAPYIKLVLAHFAIEKPGEIDVIPLLYLGVALHKVPGEESAALAAFTAAFEHGIDLGSTNTMLWARGSMSRLLRRMGRIKEAEEQESSIRSVNFEPIVCGSCFDSNFDLQGLAPLAQVRHADERVCKPRHRLGG